MEASVKEDQMMLKKLKEEEGKHSVSIEKDQDALNAAHHVIEESRNNHEKKNKEVNKPEGFLICSLFLQFGVLPGGGSEAQVWQSVQRSVLSTERAEPVGNPYGPEEI